MAAPDTLTMMVTRLYRVFMTSLEYNYCLLRLISFVEDTTLAILIPVKRTLQAPDSGPTQHHCKDHCTD